MIVALPRVASEPFGHLGHLFLGRNGQEVLINRGLHQLITAVLVPLWEESPSLLLLLSLLVKLPRRVPAMLKLKELNDEPGAWIFRDVPRELMPRAKASAALQVKSVGGLAIELMKPIFRIGTEGDTAEGK